MVLDAARRLSDRRTSRPEPGPGRSSSAFAPAACAAPTCTSSTASSRGRSSRSSRATRSSARPLRGGKRFAPGDRVGVPWLGWTCGECRYCVSGRENLCDRARFTGYDLDGGYAELAVADERFCFPCRTATRTTRRHRSFAPG